MRLHETRLIDRPLEEVFAFTSDFSNSELWDPGVETARRVGDGQPDGVGTKYELMVTFGSRQIPMVYETTLWEPNSRVVLEGRGETINAIDEIRFEERDGATLVEYTADLTFTNWMKFMAPLMAPLLNKVGAKALDGLVETLEQ